MYFVKLILFLLEDGRIIIRTFPWMKLLYKFLSKINKKESPIPPIFYLRNIFRKALELTLGKKIPPELEEIITIDQIPSHIEGDFTFPIFEIAKALKVNYAKLSLDITKNLEADEKYIRKVEAISGYINITIKPEEFYMDSLRYILNDNLLKESLDKKVKNVLLIREQIYTEAPTNSVVCQFISRLYSVFPYKLKTVCLSGDTPPHKIQSFIGKVKKAGKVEDFGNNVLAISLSKDKYQLLQRQDKTSTTILKQLTLLDIYVKENNPDIIIFSWNHNFQRIDEFLAIVQRLQIFKGSTAIVIINEMEVGKIMNSQSVKVLKDLQTRISKTTSDKLAVDLENLGQLADDTEMKVARLISYFPEMFRQLLWHASPKVLLNYNESCKKHVNELYLSTRGSVPDQAKLSKILLLKASYKVFDASLNLFEK